MLVGVYTLANDTQMPKGQWTAARKNLTMRCVQWILLVCRVVLVDYSASTTALHLALSVTRLQIRDSEFCARRVCALIFGVA